MFIPSDKVNVFPTSRRNNTIDFKSKLNTEENIVGLTNTLVGQSYIIEGLDIEKNDNIYSITKGICIISGYYFNFSQSKTINTDDEFIYFKIIIDDIENPYNTKELVCDKNNNIYTTLDVVESNENIFKGLEINTTSNENDFSDNKNCLLIAKKIGDVWVKPNESQIIKENPIIIDDGVIR